MSLESIIPNEDIVHIAEKEEPRFLSLLLKDKELLNDAVSAGIKPSENGVPGHFLIPQNDFLYTMIYKNFIKYNTLLTRSAMDSFMDAQSFASDEDKASRKGYWDKIWNRHDAAPEDYQMLKEHLDDRYQLRQFYEIWRDGDQIIKASTGHGELIKGFVDKTSGIRNINVDSYSLTMSVEEGIKKAIEHVKDRKENPNKNDAINCGIKGIDDMFKGFARRSYTVVSGMVNGGKTTLLMNFAYNMAKAGYKVAYVSLEKEAIHFFLRILSLHAMTDYNRIKTGGTSAMGLTDYWYNKLQDAAKDLLENIKPKLDCLQFVVDTPLTKILNEVDKLHSKKKIDVLIVDYLGVIGFISKTIGRPDLDLAKVHKTLMAYGRKNNLVLITALQLKAASSKEIRKKVDKVATESDIEGIGANAEDFSGSQQIIQDADNALGVFLNSDHPSSKMFVNFSKARDAESRRTIALDFDGKLCRVSDPEYGAGQIKVVDHILYDPNMTEEKMSSGEDLGKLDDDLFKTNDKKTEDKKAEEPIPENKQEEPEQTDHAQDESSNGPSDAFNESKQNIEPPKEERTTKTGTLLGDTEKVDDDDAFSTDKLFN